MSITEVEPVLKIVAGVAPLVPLLFAFRTRPILWWYALASFAADGVAYVLRRSQLDYDWVGNSFIIVEFLLLSSYYWYRFSKPLWLAVLTPLIGVCFTVYVVQADFEVANLPGAAVLCVLYMIYALFDFYLLLRRPRIYHLEKSRGFWANTAILFYAASTCFLFLFYQDILAANPINQLYWASFFFSMTLFKCGLLTTALRAKHS